MAAKQVLLTSEGLQKLQDELENLKTVRRKENTAAIKRALSFGDLSENSEYDEAKNEQAEIEARIVEIENILNNAKVIDEDNIATDVVSVGAKVKVKDRADGSERNIRLSDQPRQTRWRAKFPMNRLWGMHFSVTSLARL